MTTILVEVLHVGLFVGGEVGDFKLLVGRHPADGLRTLDDKELPPDVATGKAYRFLEVLADARLVEESFVAKEDGIDRLPFLHVRRGGTAEDVGNLRVERGVRFGVPRLVEVNLVVKSFGVGAEIREDQDAPALKRLAVLIDGKRGRERPMLRAIGGNRRCDYGNFENAFVSFEGLFRRFDGGNHQTDRVQRVVPLRRRRHELPDIRAIQFVLDEVRAMLERLFVILPENLVRFRVVDGGRVEEEPAGCGLKERIRALIGLRQFPRGDAEASRCQIIGVRASAKDEGFARQRAIRGSFHRAVAEERRAEFDEPRDLLLGRRDVGVLKDRDARRDPNAREPDDPFDEAAVFGL